MVKHDEHSGTRILFLDVAAGGATSLGSSPQASPGLPCGASLDPSAYPAFRIKFHPPLHVPSENGIFSDSAWYLEWRVLAQVSATLLNLRTESTCMCPKATVVSVATP